MIYKIETRPKKRKKNSSGGGTFFHFLALPLELLGGFAAAGSGVTLAAGITLALGAPGAFLAAAAAASGGVLI